MNTGCGDRVTVVGAGIGGMAAAARLAKDGFRVTVVERNDQAGGRARIWQAGGYTFDMGPSWYLMPEVFERFFAYFGKTTADYYELKPLDPSYRVFVGPGEHHDIPPDRAGVRALFDRLEPDGGRKLEAYLADAAYKYKVAVGEFLYRDYRTVLDFLNWRMMTEGLKLNVLGKLDAAVRKQFGDRRARQILEYAMVFLGTSPNDAPAMYSLMSHVDLTQGVFYPAGGAVGRGAGHPQAGGGTGRGIPVFDRGGAHRDGERPRHGRTGAHAGRRAGDAAVRSGAGKRRLRPRGDGPAGSGRLRVSAALLGEARGGAEHVPAVSGDHEAPGAAGAPQSLFPAGLEHAF
jgi:hypothetical protein